VGIFLGTFIKALGLGLHYTSAYHLPHHSCAQNNIIPALYQGLHLNDLDRFCLAYVSWVRVFTCMSVIPAMFYMPSGLAGCSVGPEISRGARKLARTP